MGVWCVKLIFSQPELYNVYGILQTTDCTCRWSSVAPDSTNCHRLLDSSLSDIGPSFRNSRNEIFIRGFSPRQHLECQGLLTVEASQSHSDTPQSLRNLWTSDDAEAETSTWRHMSLTTDKYPCFSRNSNQESQQSSGVRRTHYTARPL